MLRTSFILLSAIGLYCVSAPASAVAAEGKCTSIQAQCALEMGGYCNPKTGWWCYGHFRNRYCGGTNIGGAFDQCVSRKLGQKK
jgi:hypothetical protein